MPWAVNQLAIEAGHYLLAHKSDYALDLPALMAERERMARELSAIDGITDVHREVAAVGRFLARNERQGHQKHKNEPCFLHLFLNSMAKLQKFCQNA